MPRHKESWRTPEQWRNFAVKCWHKSDEQIAVAVQLWENVLPGQLTRVSEYILRWAMAFEERSDLKDQPRSGRDSTLSEADAKRAADLFVKGFKQEGTGLILHFTSIQHAIRKSPELKKILDDSEITAAQLLVRMKKANPSLRKRKIRFLQPMSEGLLQERLKICRALVRKPRWFFDRVIWIDAAKFWVSIDPVTKCWVDISLNNDMQVNDTRAPGKRGQSICLAYYAAVNQAMGPVWIGLTSGTKGYEGAKFKPRKVRFYKIPG